MNLNIVLHLIAAGILFLFIGFCALIILTSEGEKPTRRKNKRKKHKDDDYNNSYQNLETILNDIFDSNSTILS